jgi:hypothetical protein
MKSIASFTTNRLFETMNELVPLDLYPSGVLPVPTNRIAGTAFFPGGSGLHQEHRDPGGVISPVGGVMILGHNFDSEAGFNESVARGKEKLTTGTWGPLLKLLAAAEIPFHQCFFTNAFMGLCQGDDSFDYRGREHAEFRDAGCTFLIAQIETQLPRLILTLGRQVPPMLAELSPELSLWNGPNLSLSDFDAVPLVRDAGFYLASRLTHRANRGASCASEYAERGPTKAGGILSGAER